MTDTPTPPATDEREADIIDAIAVHLWKRDTGRDSDVSMFLNDAADIFGIVESFILAEIAADRAEGYAEAERDVVAWLRVLAHYPASILDNMPPRGEVWILHRSADAIERGEHRKDGL